MPQACPISAPWARARAATAEPGSSHTFIRGVVSGGDGNHSGSEPTVGTYLDEIPVTTIDGTVDMHLYDMQRIEVLEGPQGTLFGASSESGTIRLITNKPDASKFSAGYDATGTDILDHGKGYELQGFVNIPLASWAAIRLVGWIEQDPGYISNVQGTDAGGCIVNGVRTFPTWAGQPAAAGTWVAAWARSHPARRPRPLARARSLTLRGRRATTTPPFTGAAVARSSSTSATTGR